MKRQLGVIALLLMTIFIGFGIIIPVMPLAVLGVADKFHNFMLLSVYSLSSFLMSPIWGALSDRIGRRPLILTGLLGYAASFLLFGLGFEHLWMMYAARILGGLFSGAATACAVAYVADITSAENRTKGMGIVGMSIGLGFVFGPALGGLLGEISLQLPFFVSTGLSLVTFLFAFIVLKESLPVEKRRKASATAEKRPSRWTAFRGSLKYLYVLSFFVTFTLAGLEGTMQYFQMEKIGATAGDIGKMFLVSGIVGAIIQGGVIRKLVKPGTEARVVVLGLFLSALGFILVLFSSSVWTAAIYLSVFGAGNALIRPCVTSLLTQKTTVDQGITTGLNSSMDSLGRILGPLLGGALYTLNISLPYISGALLCLAAILLVTRFVQLDRHHSKRLGEIA